MTSPETAVLRQRIARLIAKRTGDASDGISVAVAAGRAHDELTAVFAPLISSGGVAALVSRAFDLARREFPADERRGDNAATDQPFDAVTRWLERQVPSAATEAAATLFATFAELLATLIGESLTMRYLQKAWPDGFSDAQPKGKKA